MPCVHYKFSSKLSYDTITFEGLHIALCYLKKEIMVREKLKAANSDLQITNAQTKEEYTDENALIPKNSSVIVRRIPARGGKSTSRRYVTRRTEPAMGTTKATDDSSASSSLNQLTKTANLAEAHASEEDKIKAVVLQSGHEYDPANYTKNTLGGLPPPSYTCFRCGKPGHFIRNCPTNGDKNSDSGPRIKKSTGIPRSFMMEVKDPTMKGAMLTNTGKYAIPIIDAEAYANGKKEKPPFLPEEPSSSSEEEREDRIPEELLCLICKDTMTDAAIIPCCGNSYCDECIRTALLESDEHTCPTCHQNDVSPDALVANKVLRQAVDNFTNKTGYPQRLRKQLPPTAPPIPPPSPLIQQNLQPLMRPPIPRQQDPPRIPVTSSSAHTTPSPSSLSPHPSSSAPSLPVNPSSVPAPVPDTTARVSLSVRPEKADGPFRDSDDKLLPAAALTSEHSKGASSIAIPALKEEEGNQVPVLGTPSLLGQSFHGELTPTTGPVGINAARPGGGRPGWERSSELGHLVSPPQQTRREERSCYRSINRGQRQSGPSRRTQGPSLPATPVFVPVPPLPLNLPPPRTLPLPPGVPSPQFSPQCPPGQPPPAGYCVPSPGFPPAPANISRPWVTSGVQTALSNTIPTPQAPPLSREEFYRQQQRLEEESKLAYSGSPHSRSSCSYSKSRSGSTRPSSYSRSSRSSLSSSYSQSLPQPRRGRGKSRNYCSRSGPQGDHGSRSRSPPSKRYRNSWSICPQAFSGQSPTKGNVPQGEKERYREWERKYHEWYENTMKGARWERSLDPQVIEIQT